MFAPLPRRGIHPRAAARTASARIRRYAATLAALACAWLGLAAAAPAAFARIIPPPAGMGSVPASAGSGTVPSPAVTVTRTVVVGGTPGWQIALIALGAALLAAAAAVLIDRVRAGRRAAPASTA